MKRLKKRMTAAAWAIMLLLGCYICVRGFSMIVFKGMENPLSGIIQAITGTCGKEVMNMYMPGVSFSVVSRDKHSPAEALGRRIMEGFPLYRYFEQQDSYDTASESDYTYEMIIAAEAADENYINHETGEVVINGNHENQEKQELLPAEENKADTEAAGTGMPAGEETQTAEAEKQEESKEPEEDSSVAAAAQPGKGMIYSLEKLSDFDFLKNTFYVVDSTTSVDSTRLNVKDMVERDLRIEQDSSVPQILIYHTHSQETFVDSVPGDPNTSIVGVGAYLAEVLANTYGYNVIHNTSTYDMIDGKLDRNYAYTLAEPDITKILKNNPSIQVVVDIHRDGVNENTHLVTEVNGKPTARFMFFNGLSYNTKAGNIEYLHNPHIAENLAFSFQMQMRAAKYYPDLTRKIFLKGYRYNLHLMGRATLVEVGGQTNTFEEAKNAMEPLADIMDKVLKGIE